MGALTEVVRRYVPASYRAMIGPSEASSYYSLSDLQAIVVYVQERLFATHADMTAEAAVWSPLQLEFIGKVATVKFIPAAIDYWMDQQEQVTTTGTNETETFANRLSHLREVQKELLEDIAQEAPYVLPQYLASTEVKVSYYDDDLQILITPDPQQFQRAYRHRPGRHPWEV